MYVCTIRSRLVSTVLYSLYLPRRARPAPDIYPFIPWKDGSDGSRKGLHSSTWIRPVRLYLVCIYSLPRRKHYKFVLRFVILVFVTHAPDHHIGNSSSNFLSAERRNTYYTTSVYVCMESGVWTDYLDEYLLLNFRPNHHNHTWLASPSSQHSFMPYDADFLLSQTCAANLSGFRYKLHINRALISTPSLPPLWHFSFAFIYHDLIFFVHSFTKKVIFDFFLIPPLLPLF